MPPDLNKFLSNLLRSSKKYICLYLTDLLYHSACIFFCFFRLSPPILSSSINISITSVKLCNISLKGLPQNEMTPLFIAYFDSSLNARLKGHKHNPRNRVFPTVKVKKPCAERSTCRSLGLVDRSDKFIYH